MEDKIFVSKSLCLSSKDQSKKETPPKFQLVCWSEKQIKILDHQLSGSKMQLDKTSKRDTYFNLKSLLLRSVWVTLITACVSQETDSVSNILFASGEPKSQVKPKSNLSL